MANEGPLVGNSSVRAHADYSGKDTAGHYYDGRFVKLAAEDEVEVCDTAGERPLGVLYGRPKQGAPAHVVLGGRVRMIAGGTLAVGDVATTDASGKVVKSTTTNHYVVGTVNEAATANQAVSVFIHGGYKI